MPGTDGGGGGEMKHEDTLARLAASAATGDEAAEASRRREASLVVAQTGQRISGCDESCGWIWESARALETALLQEVDESDWLRLRVLELGSGTGWLALRLAQLGADVTASDRSGPTTLLRRNVMRNQERCRVPGAEESALRVECHELSWEDTLAAARADCLTCGGPCTLHRTEEAPSEAEDAPPPWDWVVGSDLLYLHESHEPLLRTIAHHVGASGRTRCLLAWQERFPTQEARFVDELVAAAGLAACWVRDVEGAKGEPLRLMCLAGAGAAGTGVMKEQTLLT